VLVKEVRGHPQTAPVNWCDLRDSSLDFAQYIYWNSVQQSRESCCHGSLNVPRFNITFFVYPKVVLWMGQMFVVDTGSHLWSKWSVVSQPYCVDTSLHSPHHTEWQIYATQMTYYQCQDFVNVSLVHTVDICCSSVSAINDSDCKLHKSTQLNKSWSTLSGKMCFMYVLD